ncbi:MAG: SulP family inorganic anion transporter [Planctomycetes bacterium]|nr:SulP family inorganic anion transporter [Planctomycetota bacterium]
MARPRTGGLQSDIFSSVVVFLVALPLSMGIAIASGAPPAAGLIAGVIGGLVVGTLSGSPLQVSGPAAGLAVIVYQVVTEQGFEALGMMIVVAGGVQLLAGVLRLGPWFRAVSPAVIQGMLAGIGVLIFASQFHVMVDDAPKANGIQNLLSIPSALLKGLIPLDNSPHHWAARIGVLAILTIVGWKFLPRRLNMVPAPLMAVILCSVVAATTGLKDVIYFVDVDDSLINDIRLPAPADWRLLLDTSLLMTGVGIAMVASAETLLCATAVDQMHGDPDCRTKYDRELMAQGVGNLLSGLIGGLPITGVIVRSAANVEAGARTRLSAVLHGFWLLVFVALLPGVLRFIPTASLAAILVYTGFKLMNVSAIRVLWKQGRSEVAIYAATVAGIVATDLLKGVMIGIALSAVKLLYTFSHLEIELRQGVSPRALHLHLRGAATFIRLPKLAEVLESIPADAELHTHFDELDYVDHACLELLGNWEKQHLTSGGTLSIDWNHLHGKTRGRKPRTDTSRNPQNEQNHHPPAEIGAGAG